MIFKIISSVKLFFERLKPVFERLGAVYAALIATGIAGALVSSLNTEEHSLLAYLFGVIALLVLIGFIISMLRWVIYGEPFNENFRARWDKLFALLDKLFSFLEKPRFLFGILLLLSFLVFWALISIENNIYGIEWWATLSLTMFFAIGAIAAGIGAYRNLSVEEIGDIFKSIVGWTVAAPILIILVLIAAFLIFPSVDRPGSILSQDEWHGFVYPNRYDLTVHRSLGTFSSLENCREAAFNAGGNHPNADYECGLNCRLSSYGSGLYTCEETRE